MADDQLRLSPEWGQHVEDGTDLAPLLALDQALELSSLRRGISRDAFLKDLLRDLHHQQLIPLLLMLPRRWKVGQASLPEHLRTIGNVLETGLISPLLLATLADDLQHLLPPSPKGQQRGAIDRWSERDVALSDHHTVPLPESLDALETITATDLAGPAEDSKPGTLAKISALGGTLCWRNQGLPSLQSERAKRRNRVMAQVLNALGSNRLPSMPGASKTGGATPYQFCGVSSGRALLQHLRTAGGSAVPESEPASPASDSVPARTTVSIGSRSLWPFPIGPDYWMRMGRKSEHFSPTALWKWNCSLQTRRLTPCSCSTTRGRRGSMAGPL